MADFQERLLENLFNIMRYIQFNSHFIIEPEPKKPEKDEEEQGTKKFITRECCDFTHKGS